MKKNALIWLLSKEKKEKKQWFENIHNILGKMY
jgi:hypothetical protein